MTTPERHQPGEGDADVIDLRPGSRPNRADGATPPASPARRRDRLRRTHVGLLALVAALVALGLVMVLSASSVQSEVDNGSPWTYFARQALYAVVALGAFLFGYRTDYRFWRRVVVPVLGLSVALLVAVLVPGIGVEVNGARSWIGVGPLTFQPSELAKLALLLFLADLLTRRASRMHDTRTTLRPAVAVSALVLGLVMLEPDLGSAIVIGVIAFVVLFLAGTPLFELGMVSMLGLLSAAVATLSKTYRRDRIFAFLDSGRDPNGIGYQLNQSFTGIASGGLTGVGLGASRAKWGFLPNAHTDFIFAIVAEELGLLGALVVIGLFVAFGVLGVRAAAQAPDRFGALVAAGITAWVLVQALVNIGGVIGLMPITGLTLPFISFGGTSLVITMAATGILTNIARHGRAPRASRAARAPVAASAA